jgi:hypothetical protein
MGFIEDFRKGRDAAFAERGRAERLAAKRARRNASPAKDDGAATEELADETKELLAELVAKCEELDAGLKQRDGELEEKNQLLAELAAQCEQLQSRAEERDVFAKALQLPGARKGLRKMYHPDAHPNADADQLRALHEWSCKLNAAYELIDRQAAAERERGRQAENGREAA